MKKIITGIVSAFIAVGSFCALPVQSTINAETVTVIRAESEKVWDGTADTSWYSKSKKSFDISNAQELAGLAELVNNGNRFEGITINLTDNIYINTEVADENDGFISYKLTENQWKPIGKSNNSFSGIFNGNNCTIKGLNVAGGNTAGLFGVLENAEIRNVILGEGTISGDSYAGGICGGAFDTKFINCINGTKIYNMTGSQELYTGGIAGAAKNCFFSNCVNRTVDGLNVSKTSSGEVYTGGIAGIAEKCDFEICENYSTFFAISDDSDTYSGGICGYGASTIKQCRNDAAAVARANNGTAYSGGIIGCAENEEGSITEIELCAGAGGYANKSARAYIGGITGYGGNIINSYVIFGSTSVSNTEYSIGGISGENAVIENCYCIGGANIQNTSDDEEETSESTATEEAPVRSGILGKLGKNGKITNCYYFNEYADCAVGDEPDDNSAGLDEEHLTSESFAELLGNEFYYNNTDGLVRLKKCDAKIKGDINNDGIINAYDLSALRNGYFNGFKTLAGRGAGDVNEDNSINTNDIQALRDYILGKKKYLKEPSRSGLGVINISNI